jgi:TatD DNase family protein
MILPDPEEFIDIHTHGMIAAEGVFAVENLMAHENINPETIESGAFSAGIHPWYLSEENQEELIDYIKEISNNERLIALGEAGFDKIKGPSIPLQRSVFSEQVLIAEKVKKPLFIHCVRSWDELMAAHRNLKPSMPWIIHGFRGKKELASQLIPKGMYFSFWFDFIIRNESSDLIRFMPMDRIFLETDGADIDIRDIYRKVAGDLSMEVTDLKRIIYNNYLTLFGRTK